MTSQKPTILHVIDTTGPGGAETVFLDLAQRLNHDGFHTLALIKGSGWVQSQLEERRIPFVVLKPFGFLSIPYYFQVCRLIKQRNVKFVQAHLLGSALTFAIVSLFMKVPVVATLHGQVDIGEKERFLLIKRWLLKVGLKKVIAVSTQLAAYLTKSKIFYSGQVEVIHNGVNVARYDTKPVSNIREELGLSDDSILIGSLGNIRPAKDYPTLIRAASVVVANNPAVNFVIAGHSKEPLQSELNQLVLDHDLVANVHFLGFKNNTEDFLGQLDLFVLSSVAEGFSIATIEAMAARVPVVVTKSGGPEEIVRPGLDGWLVEISSTDQLADVIQKALSNDDGFIENGYRRVVEQFSIESSVNQYSKIANSFLNGNS